jgi:hypothetical protein
LDTVANPWLPADGKPSSGQPAAPLDAKKDNTEEGNFKEMEDEVHCLLEASAEAKTKRLFNDALTKAKEAAAKEKKIRKLFEHNNLLWIRSILISHSTYSTIWLICSMPTACTRRHYTPTQLSSRISSTLRLVG